MRIATIILAAGNSSRLGENPKQLLRYQGTTLVRRIAAMALSLQAGPVIAVLGAHQELIQTELASLPIHTVVNVHWQEGIASSLRVGLQALETSSIDAFLIVLTDQPYVSAKLLQQLMDTRQQTGKGIVACRYGEAGHRGVPALFSATYKTKFLTLSGDTGARKLIQQHADDCADILFPQASIDLDTRQDVEAWQAGVSAEDA